MRENVYGNKNEDKWININEDDVLLQNVTKQNTKAARNNMNNNPE